MRRSNVLHTVELFQPTLSLSCLTGFSPETAHEVFNFCSTALLFLIHGLLQGQALRFEFFESTVVTRVGNQSVSLEADDLFYHRIQKGAVVRNDQQSSGVALQPLLQPDCRLQIQMVGGFIQHEQIRWTHQGSSEIKSYPPTTGKAAYRLIE